MIRNGNAIVGRAIEMDGDIIAVHSFNPSGIIVHSTQDPRPQAVSPAVLRLMQFSDSPNWGMETDKEVLSGHNIITRTRASCP